MQHKRSFSVAVRDLVPDDERGVELLYDYDGDPIECVVCGTEFVETFETEECPGCSAEEY